MSIKFAFPLAFAAVCLPLVSTSHAVAYTESGDAGDLPTAAQVLTPALSVGANSITGATTLTNGLSDSDMYQITLSTAESLTASTTAFSVGKNNFDTQIALFNSAGVGILANDDAASGGSQSSLTTGTLPAGNYYLLISGSGRYATSASGLIFPNYTDGTTDPSATVGPTGSGGASAVTGYTGNSNEAGSYVISLTATLPAAVPEPSALAAIVTGFGGLGLVLRRRRSA